METLRTNVSIKDTARLMGKSEQFVRIGLQRGLLPIGTAVQLSSKYTYFIAPNLLEEYLKINLEEALCSLEKNSNIIE